MRDRIEVKLEKPPTRCEICHHDDVFDPISKYCNRCSSLEIVQKINKETANSLQSVQQEYLLRTILSGFYLATIGGHLISYGLFAILSQDEKKIMLGYHPIVILATTGTFLAYYWGKKNLTESFITKKGLLLNRIFYLSAFIFLGSIIGNLFNMWNGNFPRLAHPFPFLWGCLVGLTLGIIFDLFLRKSFSQKVKPSTDK